MVKESFGAFDNLDLSFENDWIMVSIACKSWGYSTVVNDYIVPSFGLVEGSDLRVVAFNILPSFLTD